MNTNKIKTIEIQKPSVIITKEEYEGLQETLEVLSDNELVKDIFEALAESKETRVDHEDLFGDK